MEQVIALVVLTLLVGYVVVMCVAMYKAAERKVWVSWNDGSCGGNWYYISKEEWAELQVAKSCGAGYYLPEDTDYDRGCPIV